MSALDWLVSFKLRPLYRRIITLVTHFTKVPSPLDTVAYKNCLPSGDQTPVVQLAGNHYSDGYIPAVVQLRAVNYIENLFAKRMDGALVATDVFPHSVQPRNWRETSRWLSVTSHITAISATDAPCSDDRGPI